MTSDAAAALSRALDHHRAGRLSEAERLYRELLTISPDNAEALNFLGVLRAQRDDRAESIALFKRAIAVRPDVAQYHNHLGKALAEEKDWPAAIASYRRAVELAPGFAAARLNLGIALVAVEDFAGAEGEFRAVLTLAPSDTRALSNLGFALLGLARAVEAEACFRVVLEARPNDPGVVFNLGCAYRSQRNLSEAETCFRRAVALRPDFAAALAELGGLRLAQGDMDEAENLLGSALKLEPGNWSALISLGQLRMIFADFEAAYKAYARAIAANPEAVLAWRNRLMAALYDAGLEDAARTEMHREFGRAMADRVTRTLPPLRERDRDPERRLRVGWLSSDFRRHSVGRNLQPMFARRDAARFEFVCYAEEKEQPDDVTEWFRAHSDLSRRVTGLSDAAVAEQIRADSIDVMIYVAGRFDHNRPQVACWRPAPVQVSLFDAATSGLASMDYFIANRFMVPWPTTEYFAERVVCVPNFYAHRPLTEAPEVGPPPLLSAGHATFACFNNPVKVSPPVLDLWGRTLDRVPGARLQLKYERKYGSERLQARVRDGIGAAAGRIDFDGEHRDLVAHLNLYNDVDIALDPFPFTGSTTTFEALWMGVPVVTLAGTTFMGRWTASMLHALKLDELIARTPEEYVEIAAGLAADPGRLAALRASLRERVARSPLCSDERLMRHFERLIRALWRRWCRAG